MAFSSQRREDGRLKDAEKEKISSCSSCSSCSCSSSSSAAYPPADPASGRRSYHFFVAAYMCFALALLCDDFFVIALDVMIEKVIRAIMLEDSLYFLHGLTLLRHRP